MGLFNFDKELDKLYEELSNTLPYYTNFAVPKYGSLTEGVKATAKPAQAGPSWKCHTYGCPDRKPQMHQRQPVCYTCGCGMDQVPREEDKK